MFQDGKAKVKAVAASGQLGIFANGYWGHPAMQLSPEVNLLAFSHYLQALEYQRKAKQVVGMLGFEDARTSRTSRSAASLTPSISTTMATLNMEKLVQIKDLLDEVVTFVQQVYVPDACAIAAHVRRLVQVSARV